MLNIYLIKSVNTGQYYVGSYGSFAADINRAKIYPCKKNAKLAASHLRSNYSTLFKNGSVIIEEYCATLSSQEAL